MAQIAIRALARHDDWARERRDQVIVSFQKYASVPIFNMESVLDHPCQAWGDALTLEEEFDTEISDEEAEAALAEAVERHEARGGLVLTLDPKTGDVLALTEAPGFDPTEPGPKRRPGTLHPITVVQNELVDLFTAMGFSWQDGPEIETEEFQLPACTQHQLLPLPAADMRSTLRGKRCTMRHGRSPRDASVLMRK